VSQDREAGTKPFTGRDQVDRTPAYPSLGAVGAGSNAGPHFFWVKRRKHFFQQAKELRPTEGSSGKRRSSGQRRKHFFWGKKSPLSAADFARAFHSESVSPRQSLRISLSGGGRGLRGSEFGRESSFRGSDADGMAFSP
jgi:hypothetical protein